MWIIIISLLFLGLILLILEIVFIPGTTVVGLLGIAFSVVGVIVGYKQFGDETGFYILMGTLVSTAIALYFSFRSDAWKSFSLNSSIKGKVNEGTTAVLTEGEIGTTISALRPIGKAEFQEKVFEVRSIGGNYIEPKTRIRITKIDGQQILVEAEQE